MRKVFSKVIYGFFGEYRLNEIVAIRHQDLRDHLDDVQLHASAERGRQHVQSVLLGCELGSLLHLGFHVAVDVQVELDDRLQQGLGKRSAHQSKIVVQM